MTKSDRIFVYRIWDKKNERWHTSYRRHTVWMRFPHFYRRYKNAADLEVVEFEMMEKEREEETI